VIALVTAADTPLPAIELAAALAVGPELVASATDNWPGLVTSSGHVGFAESERRRRYSKLGPARRRWAHRQLAAALRDPVDRVRHACRAGDGRQALGLLRELEAQADLAVATRCELRRLLIAARPGRHAVRTLHRELAHLAWAANQVSEAEASLRAAGASERARDPVLRLLWAHIHNRRGQFSASLQLTRSLLRSTLPDRADDGDVVDLHARNLLLLGKAEEALRLLDHRLTRPGPAATKSELQLHLTRERCAREAGPGAPAGQRLLDLARVVREARRRRARDLEAQAAFRVGVALSDAGGDARALRWLQRARSAWLALGDAYRAAEVENSLGIVLKSAGQVPAAIAQFESAIARLEELHDRQAVGVVRLNLADLRMDLLDLAAARAALAFCQEQLEQGVLRRKSDLMHIECLLLEGAAADLLLARLDELRTAIAEIDRPAVQAYYYLLRGRLLRRSGRRSAAATALQRAIDLYARSGQPAAAATSSVEWAALQDDDLHRRSGVARALWLSRRNVPPLVAHAHAVLRDRPRPPLPRLPLLAQRVREACAAIEAARGDGGSLDGHADRQALLAAAHLVARSHSDAAPADLLAFCSQHLGADAFLLRRRGPVGSSAVVAGHGVESEPRQERRPASLLVVEQGDYQLTLAHSSIALRFGRREQDLARELLDLLATRAAVRGEPAAEPTQAVAAAPALESDGVSDFVRRVQRELPALAASDLPLVLEGPTGSGKDRLARHVHALSPRARGSYVVVDCAALQETLVESELLGHGRGAFTGAGQARLGLIELADAGTLVLDEPGSLSPRAQSLLTHVLERGCLRRVGESVERRVSPRVVALTRLPLAQHVERGVLRSELYYRLLGARFALPPLAERIEDLPVLLASLIAAENAGRRRGFDPQAITALAREAWPGNVTELRNRVRRALLLEPGSQPLSARALGADTEASPTAEPRRLPELLRAEERRVLSTTLSQNGGHRERTARELGITRRWLQKRIKELGLR
jgi:DNA-binding NtrC family response regulator/tetratricopeptide (TPR) repeat protein